MQSARLIRARTALVLDAPFFGSLLMRLRMVRDDGKATFCTDGRHIRYNEAFAASLTDAELRGVLIHEVCHCAQGHLWRLGHRDPRKWNVATDYSINGLLTEYIEDMQKSMTANGRGTFHVPWELPKGRLLDPALSGKSSEEIYNLLPDPPPQESGGGSQGSASSAASPGGNPGDGAASPGEFEAPSNAAGASDGAAELERDWQVAVTMAATAQKMRGTLPCCIQRMIGELLEPKVPWRAVLREFIRQHARDDYSWQRPNRRYQAQGVILPGLHSERMGRLAIAVDTSGSIDECTLAEFQAEIQAALDECAPEAVDVIYCDAEVNGTAEFRPGDTVRLESKGGGGTRFEPVFDHIAASELEHDAPPVACIYLTDGHGSFPEHEPDYPVLWATTDRQNFPWGQVVAVK